MLCPVCEHIELKISERQGIEIDYCPRCRGVWLDRGELDKIIERAAGLERERYSVDAPKAKRGADYDDDFDDTDYPSLRKRKNDDPYRAEQRRYDDDDRRHPRRRKSIFEDIFDIFD
jgi:Zn-finger nucleic acid-binding protein